MATKKKTTGKLPDPGNMSYEQCLEELEAIIEMIESGDIGLEESLAKRHRGDQLITRSRSILDKAEQDLEQISAKEKKPGRN